MECLIIVYTQNMFFDKLSLLHAILFTLAKYNIFTVVKLVDYYVGPKSTFVSVNFESFFKNVLCIIHKLDRICMIDFDWVLKNIILLFFSISTFTRKSWSWSGSWYFHQATFYQRQEELSTGHSSWCKASWRYSAALTQVWWWNFGTQWSSHRKDSNKLRWRMSNNAR